MAENFNQTGVVQVNGAWATSIRYSANALGADTETVELRFMQGRAEVARTAVARLELSEVLGEANRNAIERQLASNADKYLPVVTGELRGPKLHYRDVELPGQDAPRENTIAQAPIPERGERSASDIPRDPQSQRGPSSDASGALPENPAQDAEAPSDRDDSRDDTAGSQAPPVPPHIAAKYLVKGDAYHFDDQTLAFVDRGTSLTAQTHNLAVIADLIAIAQAREWRAVTVSGTKDFRREAWKAASAAGLTVSGYIPSEIERLAAQRQRDRRAEREPPNGEPRTRTPASAAPAPQRPRESAKGITPAEPAMRYGTLVAHGEAPYRHDPQQQASYFVTVRDGEGHEHTAWGVGLKDALLSAKTAPAVGDAVGVRQTGAIPVTVTAQSVDEHGEVTLKPKETQRKSWEIEKVEYFSARPEGLSQRSSGAPLTREEEIAAAIRSAATTREELQLKYPELNRAVFQHLDSHDRFAEAYIRSGLIREADRAQVIEQMRERLAQQIERGKAIREPDNEQVNALIRRSVNRVAADIGRRPLDIEPPAQTAPPAPMRDDVQVRL